MYLFALIIVITPLIIYSLMVAATLVQTAHILFSIILSKEKIFVDILVSRMNISLIMELAV
jgi:hypothetical protein